MNQVSPIKEEALYKWIVLGLFYLSHYIIEDEEHIYRRTLIIFILR